MPESFSSLLATAITIAEETQEGANSAERVGGFLINALKGMTLAYDPNSAYEPGQYVVFSDAIYRSLLPVAVGENPSNSPLKWRLLTGRDGLDEVASRGTDQTKGRTTQLLKLLGGLILGNIELTTEELANLVIDADGKVWKTPGGPVTPTPTAPPDTWRFVAHYIEADGEESEIYALVDSALFTPDQYRIANSAGIVAPALNIQESAFLQLRVEQRQPSGSYTPYTATSPSWAMASGTPSGIAISSDGLLTVAINSISADTTVTVQATVAGVQISTTVNVQNIAFDYTANMPSSSGLTNYHSYDFTSGGGTDPEDWPVGYNLQAGSWNFGNAIACQTNNSSTNPLSSIYYSENGSQNSLGRTYTRVRVKPHGMISSESWIGVGTQVAASISPPAGFLFLISSPTQVVLIQHGGAILATATVSLQNDIWYWMSLSAVPVGTDQTQLTGKIWTAGTVEPTESTVEFTVTSRLTGYPALFGGHNGATACFDFWADANLITS